MSKLPQEVLTNIFDNLSISDIQNVIDSSTSDTKDIPILATVNQVETELYDRENPIKYLDKAFYNPRQLLVNMGIHGMLLSGSRALNYFMKGTCDEDSDWDFYCHYNDQSIVQNMEALRQAGVIWETAQEKLLRLANNSTKQYVGSDQDRISVKRLCDSNHYVYDIDDLGIINYYIHKFDDSYAKMHLQVVNGTVTKNNRVHKVQLIFSTKKLSPVECILNYHSTILQCFMAFGGACHMYRDDLEQRQSYYLPRNEGKLSYDIIIKYNKRGITFKHQNGDIITPSTDTKVDYGTIPYVTLRSILNTNILCDHRSIRDNKSMFISFKEYYENDITVNEDLGICDILYNTLTKFHHSQYINIPSYIDTAGLYLKYISWYDTRYSTIISDNLIDIIYINDKVNLPVIIDTCPPASLTRYQGLTNSLYIKKESIYESTFNYFEKYGVIYSDTHILDMFE